MSNAIGGGKYKGEENKRMAITAFCLADFIR
jgi:hypothetical protein